MMRPSLYRRACTCRHGQPCATCTAWRRLAFALWGRMAERRAA